MRLRKHRNYGIFKSQTKIGALIMNAMLEQIVSDCRHYTAQGHVATYIPQLAVVDPGKIGIYFTGENGQDHMEIGRAHV